MAVGIGNPCIAWLVENVTDDINKFNIGHDGRIAYERFKGKTYYGVIHEFGTFSTSRRVNAGEMGAKFLVWEKVYHRRTHNWSRK